MVDFNTFLSFFNIIIFNNEIWRYLFFIVSMFLVYPMCKIINYLINNILKKFTSKTSWKFDDILIASINPSIDMFIFAGMFYVGYNFLNPEFYFNFFRKAFNLFMIIPVIYFLIKFSTELIGFYLKQGSGRRKANEAAIDLLMQMVKFILFAIGVLMIVGNLGYDVTAVLAGLGVGGLAFALAAQDILKNFFAGVALIFDKTFNKGERVRYNGHVGIIEELKLRTTKVRTMEGTLLTIPNSKLAEDVVENVTKVPQVRVRMVLTVTYDTSSKKLIEAKKIIEKAILAEEKANKEKYWIWFDNFNSFSLDIEVIYFGEMTMDDWPDRAYFKERINFAIKEGFEKAGIEFAFPTQTIDLKKGK